MRAIIVAVLVLAATPAAAEPRTVTKHYIGAPTSAGVVFCGAPRPFVDGAGRACALVGDGETTIDVTIADAAAQPVAGRYVFFGRVTGLGEEPDVLGSGTFCGSTSAVALPEGTTHVDVEVGDHLDTPNGACGELTAGTYGTVTISFR